MDISLRVDGGASTIHPHDKKNESRSTKPSNFNDILDDLLLEILVRMPFDSVCRCKSVSKRWLSLISCQNFTQQYMLRKPICRSAVVLYDRISNLDDIRVADFGTKTSAPCKILKLSFSFLPKEAIEKIYTLRSCNGLILCCSEKMFYICNPLTKQWVALPPPPMHQKNVGFICLNYPYPRFKVVVVQEKTLSCFCSESGNWREFCLSWPNTGEMVASNGMLYGLSYAKLHLYDPYNKPNEVGTIDRPYELRGGGIITDIGGNQGKIRFFKFTKTSRSTCHWSLQIWELDDYESSKWSFINKISFGTKISRLVEESSSLRIVAFKEINEDIAYIWTSKHVFRFNMKTRMTKLVMILDNLPWRYIRPFLFPCPTPVPHGCK